MRLIPVAGRRQLSRFGSNLKTHSVGLGAVVVGASLLYAPVFARLGLFRWIESVVPTRYVLPYFVSSFLAAVLIATSNAMERQTDEPDTGSSGDDERVERSLSESAELLFVQIAKLNALTVLVFSGVVGAFVTAEYIDPLLAPVVAITYPVADMKLYQRLDRPVTPVTVAMVLSYVPAAVVAVLFLAVSVLAGLVIGPPLAVGRLLSQLPVSDDAVSAVRDVISLPTLRSHRPKA